MRTTLSRLPLPALAFTLLIIAQSSFASAPEPDVPSQLQFSRTFETPGNQAWTFVSGNTGAPLSLSASADTVWNLSSCAAVSVSALRQKSGSSVVRLRWLIRSRIGGLYCSSLPTVVPAGKYAAISAPLSDAEHDLIPVGHQRPWDSLAASEVTALELRAECYYAATAANEIIALVLANAALDKQAPAAKPAVLLDLDVQLAPEGSRAAALLSFRIEPPPQDPFAPEGEGDVRVTLPGGRQALAYLDQNFAAMPDGKASRNVAAGRALWRVYLPEWPAAGELHVTSGERKWIIGMGIGLRNGDSDSHPIRSGSGVGELQSDASSVPRPPTPANRPPSLPLDGPQPKDARLSGEAPEAYALSGGEWKPALLAALGGATKTWAPVPFWTAKWGGFGGATRPSGELAQHMDELLLAAAKLGETRPLSILDGATFERQGVFNWDHHPLNGLLAGPGELFRDRAGIDFCRRWMRYSVARWGMSKAVSGFLIGATASSPGATEFHAAIAPSLAQWTAASGLGVTTLHPFARPAQLMAQLTSFEPDDTNPLSAWRVDGRAAPGTGQRINTGGAAGPSCVEVKALAPAQTSIALTGTFMLGTPQEMLAADVLLFDVWIPPAAPSDLRVGVHICDRAGRWYDALLPGMTRPGDWNTYALDLTQQNYHQLKPVKHDLAWNGASRGRMTEIGLHLYSTHPNWMPPKQSAMTLSARFDNIRAVRFERSGGAPPPAPPKEQLVKYANPGAVSQLGFFNGADLYRWDVDQRLCQASGSKTNAGREGGGFEVKAYVPASVMVGVVGTVANKRPSWNDPPDSFAAADALLFDVWTPAGSPPDLRVGVHVRDRDGQWFEALLPGVCMANGWMTFALDLSGENFHGLRGVMHKKAWTDYSRHRVPEIGIHVYSTHPNWLVKGSAQPLTVRVDNIRGARFERPELRPAIAHYELPDSATGPAAEIYRKGTEQKEYAVGDLWQHHFRISKVFANPYDPELCDAAAVIVTPTGKKVRVPAFFNQYCERRERSPGGDEVVEAIGDDFFTVRYRILEPGPHNVMLELREGGKYDVDERDERRGSSVHFVPGRVTAALDLGAPAFQAKAAPKPYRGFVRTAANKRNLQWDDGSLYYPIGPCLRSPSDSRIPYLDAKWNVGEIDRIGRRGTYQYDDYFAEFQKNGINWARVWMCSWWGALEWRRDWPGYQGLGRYNQLNAWRMDYLLDQAEKKSIGIMLCLTNHGQASTRIDQEWSNSPYSANLGGPLANAREFFSDAGAKKLHQNKLRYIVARYGHSPAVMAWSLFSEVEWTQLYEEQSLVWNGWDRPAPAVEQWHADMGAFLKATDPNRHLVSTHFSHPIRGEGTLSLPEIDIPSSNAYSAFEEFRLAEGVFDAASALADYWSGNNRRVRGFAVFGKPALVEEQGRHWMGVEHGKPKNTKDQLDADLHAGLWGSMVQPLCGATGYWWWLHLHFDNRYDTYRGLAKFMEGEDFRAKDGEAVLEPVYRSIAAEAGGLRGRALKSNRRMYAWVYHQNTPLGGDVPDVGGGTMKVSGLKPGVYQVEFWDTYRGVVTERRDVTINDGKSVELPLPVVRRDLAIKVKPK